MSKTSYKRLENTVARSSSSGARRVLSVLAIPFKALAACARHKITIMLVPHSQKNVISIQASVLSIGLFLVIVVGMFSAFLFYSSKARISARTLASLEREVTEAQASLDRLKDETSSLLDAAQNFQRSFSETLSLLGVSMPSEDERMLSGDLASFFNIRRTESGTLPEIAELRQVAAFLEQSVQPIEEIGKLLSSRDALFSDIPSLWPIKGGIGHVSQSFGQNRHPFSRQWYIHKGIDLSTYRSGDPVIATASGQVIMSDYDPAFGNYILLRHKHGFYTRYAHLLSQTVKRGDYVNQGDTIGHVGNTGISTGPHLHYEVHIGSEVVDPSKYFNIR